MASDNENDETINESFGSQPLGLYDVHELNLLHPSVNSPRRASTPLGQTGTIKTNKDHKSKTSNKVQETHFFCILIKMNGNSS